MTHANRFFRSSRPATLAVALALACGLSGCFQPPRSMPNESVLGFDGKNAVGPDCDALTRPSLLTDAGFHRPSMQWGCATYTNLAAQVAHPKDLVAPEPAGPANGATAASAMRRYETGKIIPLDTSSSRDSK
jgi:pilus assembly protein CpaD